MPQPTDPSNNRPTSPSPSSPLPTSPLPTDPSNNSTTHITYDVSYTVISDVSLNNSFISICPDDEVILQPMPSIVHLSGSTTTTGPGYVIVDSSGTDASGSFI